MRRHEAALFSVAWTGLVVGATAGAVLARIGRSKEMKRFSNAFYMWKAELAEALDGDVFPEVDGPVQLDQLPLIEVGDKFDPNIEYPFGTVVQRIYDYTRHTGLRIAYCRDGIWRAENKSYRYDASEFEAWGNVYVMEVGPSHHSAPENSLHSA